MHLGSFCFVAAWDYGREGYAITMGMCGYRGSFCVSCVTRSIRGGPNAGCGQQWPRGRLFVLDSASGSRQNGCTATACATLSHYPGQSPGCSSMILILQGIRLLPTAGA